MFATATCAKKIKKMYVKKTKKEVQEVVVESYYKCDKCDERISRQDMYDAFECEFMYKTGESYPEGGHGTNILLELCQDCGKEAINLLRDNGFKTQKKEWDI
jgi:hypothetical protein